jgi:hypothetical protein
MQLRFLAALGAAGLLGCAGTIRNTQWPYRGPMMMVRNPTPHTVVVLARDGTGRELITARVRPNGKQCFRWPFIHAIGYLVAAESPRDTLTTEPFQPWSADGWEWSGQPEPTSNPNACR